MTESKMTRTMLEIELSATQNELELVKESYADAARAMIRMEDIGWQTILGGAAVDPNQRFTVETLHDISEKLREWTDTNPLLIRGNQVRCSYMFDGGFVVGTKDGQKDIPVRVQNLINDPVNQGSVFGNAALSINEKARFTDGQIFALFNSGTNRFQMIPFKQITDAYTNPDDPGEVWYYKWTRSRRVADAKGVFTTSAESTWIPVDTFTLPSGTAHPQKLGNDLVDTTKKIVDSRVNRIVGQTWGVADSFGAAPWALAYSNYLRDGTRVLSGLAEFIWQLKPKNKKQGDKAGAQIRTSEGTAGTVISDMDIQSLPRANAVDLKTGRPIASQVAAALGISTVMLMSDSEQVGGSNTEASLADPTIRTMADRRALNTEFLVRCVRLLGVKDAKINWSKMAPDSDFREMQLKVAALQTGQFHPDETRSVLGKLAGFDLKHNTVPDGYLLPNNEKSLPLKSIDSDASPTAAASGQGGAAVDAKKTAKPSYGNNDLRDGA